MREAEFVKKLSDIALVELGANLLLCITKFLGVRPDYFFQGYTAEELSARLNYTHPCGRALSPHEAAPQLD
jgi:hypothetical protein